MIRKNWEHTGAGIWRHKNGATVTARLSQTRSSRLAFATPRQFTPQFGNWEGAPFETLSLAMIAAEYRMLLISKNEAAQDAARP